MSTLILKIILFLTGAVVIALGANIAFGGIGTLGLQGPTEFFTVTDQAAFDIRDNHVRFVGGVFLGCGGVLMASALWSDFARVAVPLVAAVFVIGGVARLSAADMSVLAGPDIAPSLMIELIGFPLLAFWTLIAVRQTQHDLRVSRS